MILVNTIKNRILIPFAVETKNDAAPGEIKGLGAAFNNKDGGNDIIHPGAFKKSIEFYHEVKAMPAMLWNHDTGCPVGDWKSLEERDTGLHNVGDIWHNKGMPNAEMAYNVARGTGMKGMSIGYKTLKADRDSKTGVRHIYDVALKEISILLWPMNDKAEIHSVKGMMLDKDGKFKSIRDLEEIIRETLDLSNREIKALLAHGYKGLASLRDEETDQEQVAKLSAELIALAQAIKL